MAATAPPLRSVEREQPATAPATHSTGFLVVSALTIFAVLIHGYHPYAEDGGLYLAGIKRVLRPDLYPYWSGFTTAHLRFSLFAPMAALLVRVSHLRLMTVMLLTYVASTWATLYAAWQIAIRCYARIEACFGAVAFLALLLTVPVAGTSLMLMDPYVSARSISTPCGLLALVAVIDMTPRLRARERISVRSLLICFGSLFLASLVHPLMAVYAMGSVLVLVLAGLTENRLQWGFYGVLGLVAVMAAALLIHFSPVPPPGYAEVARTRSYWFPGTWHWYELAGLAAPLMVLGIIRFRRSMALPALPDNARNDDPKAVTSGAFVRNKAKGYGTGISSLDSERNKFDNTIKSLAQTGIVIGGLSIAIATLFARVSLSSYAVARLQPLRAFQAVYVITIVMVGAALGRFVLQRTPWRWAAMTASLGGFMLFVQLASFPDSNHLELPWVKPSNGWEQAFLWIKGNTTKGTVVALDADYISESGEDAQNFRAIAERSAIPDYSKDGGIASIAPDLTAEWIAGETAQKGLDRATDRERLDAIRDIPANWIVLSSGADTAFKCDYANASAKVCRVPGDLGAHPITPRKPGVDLFRSSNVARPTEQVTSRH